MGPNLDDHHPTHLQGIRRHSSTAQVYADTPLPLTSVGDLEAGETLTCKGARVHSWAVSAFPGTETPPGVDRQLGQKQTRRGRESGSCRAHALRKTSCLPSVRSFPVMAAAAPCTNTWRTTGITCTGVKTSLPRIGPLTGGSPRPPAWQSASCSCALRNCGREEPTP